MPKAQQTRRRDPVATKARILSAATEAFSDVGYAQAGIRDIAERAGVTSPMLLHYFGSKLGLFKAVLIDAVQSETVLAMPKEGFGERLIAVLADADLQISPPALAVLSIGDADARDMTTEVLLSHVVSPLADWLEGPDAPARAVRIAMLAISYVLFTRQLPVAPLGSDEERNLADWIAEAIQQTVEQL